MDRFESGRFENLVTSDSLCKYQHVANSNLIEKRMIVCHSQSHVYQRRHHRYDILLNLLATTVAAASAISSNAANIYLSSSASTEYVKGVQCRNQCRARDS